MTSGTRLLSLDVDVLSWVILVTYPACIDFCTTALLQAPRRLKSQAILTTLYAAGLRVSELCHLQVTDVDSSRMVLRIQQGKGQQDRYVMLASSLLILLRQYWQRYKPRPWLFPGRDPAQCDHCGHVEISYNSCRNRHCPKCPGRAQAAWLAARERELLDVPYCHVVFTLPAALSPLALQNPRVVYTLLFQAVAATLQTIAREPEYLGAEIGFLGVLHTWGQTLHHHPHIHCLVPAGGLALDGTAWMSCPKRFFLPVRVLSRFFRRTFLTALQQAAAQEHLSMQGQCQRWSVPAAWRQFLTALRQKEWVVYAKPPLAGPQAILRYLARYTHRIAITNRRLLALQDGQVTFRWKDYQRGHRQRIMTLDAVEFIRRFLLHVLPRGFQRMRHYGFCANGARQGKLPLCRQLLGQVPLSPPAPSPPVDAGATASTPRARSETCPVCRTGRMQVQETWCAQRTTRDLSRPLLGCDTS